MVLSTDNNCKLLTKHWRSYLTTWKLRKWTKTDFEGKPKFGRMDKHGVNFLYSKHWHERCDQNINRGHVLCFWPETDRACGGNSSWEMKGVSQKEESPRRGTLVLLINSASCWLMSEQCMCGAVCKQHNSGKREENKKNWTGIWDSAKETHLFYGISGYTDC